VISIGEGDGGVIDRRKQVAGNGATVVDVLGKARIKRHWVVVVGEV
jgi:hypothetical protein